MISASLLMIAVMGASSQMVFQLRAEGSMNLNMQTRSIMMQLTSKVLAMPSDFPAYFKPGGQPITYIGCFDKAGSFVADKNGLAGYYGTFLTSVDPTLATDFCPTSLIEGHVTPYAAGRAWVDLIILPNTGRQFTVIRSTFRSDLQFELAI